MTPECTVSVNRRYKPGRWYPDLCVVPELTVLRYVMICCPTSVVGCPTRIPLRQSSGNLYSAGIKGNAMMSI